MNVTIWESNIEKESQNDLREKSLHVLFDERKQGTNAKKKKRKRKCFCCCLWEWDNQNNECSVVQTRWRPHVHHRKKQNNACSVEQTQWLALVHHWEKTKQWVFCTNPFSTLKESKQFEFFSTNSEKQNQQFRNRKTGI